MAGIGFELRRLIHEDGGLISRIRGYTIAGLVSSGPWIVTIMGLLFINAAAPLVLQREVYEEFRAIVTYAFAFSLIIVGIVQMSLTRRAADLLYARRYSQLLPALAQGVRTVGFGQAALGALFCWLVGLPIGLSIAAILLYVIVSLTWLALIWCGATKDHQSVLHAYCWGTLVAFIGVFCTSSGFLGIPQSAPALVMAYALGQGLTLVLLLKAAIRALDMGGTKDQPVLKTVKTYPRLALVGFVYNAAIWVDQIVFWIVDGVGVQPYVSFHPLYDSAKFIAYATVIPTLAIMLVRIETSFYECYRAFYGSILQGFPLEVIEERKAAMLTDLRESTVRLLRVQGFVTILMILLAPTLVEALGMGEAAIDIIRACCIGAFFHVLLLVVILIQLYFDLRSNALWTAIVFLALNGAMAVWSVSTGLHSYGVGYAIASFFGLVFGYWMLTRNYDRLEYLAFTTAPVELDDEPKKPEGSA